MCQASMCYSHGDKRIVVLSFLPFFEEKYLKFKFNARTYGTNMYHIINQCAQ